MKVYAEVIVDIKHHAVDQMYDYLIPDHLDVEIGQRVVVPFGNRTITGYVMRIKQETSVVNVKAIIDIKDITPLLNEELIMLAKTLAYQQASPRLAFFDAMLPTALKLKYETILVKQTNHLKEPLKSYFEHTNEVPLAMLDVSKKIIREAIKNKDLKKDILMKQSGSIKTVDVIYLKNIQTVRGTKQEQVIEYLKSHHHHALKKVLMEETKASYQTLKSLKTKEVIDIVPLETYREIQSLYESHNDAITLNDDQTLAYESVREQYHTHKTFLLHGVTSSGKTELYIAWTKDMLSHGKQVMVLLPEIALTPKITARFKAVFKEKVAVYHSRLSKGEQYDEWRKVNDKEATIIIGARSAVFAPFDNLGLIIMDEEHSEAYYQSEHPRYQASTVASMRAKYHNIPLVLGSATPSVESYYQAKQGIYTLLTLKKRALNAKRPSIKLVDMKAEFLKGHKSIFSKTLEQAIKKRLDQNEQTLLLINRRGHANFVLCRSCGQAVMCDTCHLPMTYHKHDHTLKCHYCLKEKPVPKICPHCQSTHIRYMGLGSERVEEALKETFKDARIFRMDKDTTTEKNAHEKVLYDFEDQGDILVGTQMIAKGLDLEKVTLVGVLSADMSLNIPTYDAKEETFALLTQIAGRAGRRAVKGEVIIQAYDSTHETLQMVKANDYEAFYDSEIEARQKALLPPIMPLIALIIEHENMQIGYKNSIKFAKLLKEHLPGAIVLGPTKAKFFIRGHKVRYQIIVKTQDIKQFIKQIHNIKPHLDDQALLHIDYHTKLF